jgi:hypothetical protein
MSDKIFLITYPDDCFEEGIRIFTFDLDENQSSMLSRCLSGFTRIPTTIIYDSKDLSNDVWNIDKIQKSDLIFFNAESIYQNLVGYLCSKMNSYYFGQLKGLSLLNKSVIFDEHQLKEILERRFDIYGKL